MASTMASKGVFGYLMTLCKLKHLKLSQSQHHAGLHSLLLPSSSIKLSCTSHLTRSVWTCSPFSVSKSQSREPSTVARKEKPRQPANVFILFLSQVEPKVKQQNPNAKRTEIVSQASKMWSDLDPEEKARLTMQRKEMYDKYKKEMAVYLENLTPEEIKAEEKVKQKKASKKLKKERRELGMPHKPLTAFSCFVADRFQERSGETVVDYFKQLYDHWSRMSDMDKEKYHVRSAELKQTYQQDMERWENEMMQMGRFDVVRKSTLARLSMSGKRKRVKKNDNTDDQEL